MSISSINMKAYAKVNPVLNVGGIRQDGYHEVMLMMMSVDLYDELTIEKDAAAESGKEQEKTNETAGVIFETVFPEGGSFDVPDEKNLAVRAARIMQRRYHLDTVRIRLIKRIPMAAGMAGGSTDAAAVINGMNELFELKLPLEVRQEIGAELGSDVPFCLQPGCALCAGRGEKVTYLPDFPECELLVIKPSFGVSTPWAYRNYVSDEIVNPPADLDKMMDAVRAGDLRAFACAMGNQLAMAVMEEHPLIERVISEMEKRGAIRAMMTGSGPSVFGIFDSARSRDAAGDEMEKILAELDPRGRIIRTGMYKRSDS